MKKHVTALQIVKAALIQSGSRVVAMNADRLELIDNMKIALNGIVSNVDRAVERYRDTAGMMLDVESRKQVERIRKLTNGLINIINKTDPRNPHERLSKVVDDFGLAVEKSVKLLLPTLDRRSLSITLQLCQHLEESAEALVHRASRVQLEHTR
jgi:hypothetical protein